MCHARAGAKENSNRAVTLKDHELGLVVLLPLRCGAFVILMIRVIRVIRGSNPKKTKKSLLFIYASIRPGRTTIDRE